MYYGKILLVVFCMLPIYGYGEEVGQRSLYQVPLSWRNDSDEPFALSAFKGRSVVLTMAYASCRSACPMTIRRLKTLEEKMHKQCPNTEFVLISLDPKRDTVQAMQQFRKEHALSSARWHLLKGSEEDTRTFSNLIEFNYQQNPNTQEINHSNKILLLNPEGEISSAVEGLNTSLDEIVMHCANSTHPPKK